MRTLIFSDTHLTQTFGKKRYKFLKRIISNADRVIINGDFWEGYAIKFEEFIESEWSKLFPILKSKKTVYVYGNHDKKKYCNKSVELFSDTQTVRYEFKSGEKTFIVEHGNKYCPFPDEKMERAQLRPSLVKKGLQIERFLVRETGTKLISMIYGQYNEKMKQKFLENNDSDTILIAGHTHLAEVDTDNRYINTGIILHGLGEYLIIEKDKIELKQTWYDEPVVPSRLYPPLMELKSITSVS